MTVKELIQELEKCNNKDNVCLYNQDTAEIYSIILVDCGLINRVDINFEGDK